MPFPMSKTALDKLGKRMAASSQISDADLDQFALVASACDAAGNQVRAMLAELGFNAPPRVKTTGTLVDKLRRQHTRLSQVQDLAGARFVVLDRLAQDEAVGAVCAKFESLGYACKQDDLREDGRDSHGYRAFHVIIYIDQIPVEVQIRTELQDRWAQIVETLGDRWGRGIRYGQGPEAPDAPLVADSSMTRMAVMQLLSRLSLNIAQIETAHVANARSALTLDGQGKLLSTIEQQTMIREQSRPLQLPEETRARAAKVVAAAAKVAAAGGGKMRQPRGRIQDMSASELLQVVRDAHELSAQANDRIAKEIRDGQRELRDTLQLFADAIDEEGLI
jgi:hypothetical protein